MDGCILQRSQDRLGHPGTKDGIYRIKVYNSERDHYWKYDPSSQRVQLATVDESEHSPGFLFKVDIFIIQISGSPLDQTISVAHNQNLHCFHHPPRI